MVGGKIQGENRGKNSKFLDDAKRSGKVGRDTHRYVERSHPRSPAHDFIKGYNGYERRKGRKETKKKKKLAGSRKGGWRGRGREEKGREEKRKQRDGDHPQGRIMAGKMRWATPCQAF